MDYRELYKNDLSGFYLFFGCEKLLMENTLKYIINKYIPKGTYAFNLSRVNNFNELYKSAWTLPVMSEKKLILIDDGAMFESELEDFEKFKDFLDNFFPYNILIIMEGQNPFNKTKKFYRYFQGQNRNVEFSKLRGSMVNSFVDGYFLRKGIKVSKALTSYMIEKSGYNSRNLDMTLYDLKNEMDKLIALGEITKEKIDSLMTDNIDTNVFALTDAIGDRNLDISFKELHNLYKINEPVQKTFVIIQRQIRLLLAYKILQKAEYTPSSIMNIMEIKNYEFTKVSNFQKNFELEELKEIYSFMEDIDLKLKSTDLDQMLLMEMLITKICKKNPS